MAQEQATYSHGHHASVVTSHARRTVQDSAAFLIPHIQPTHKILDIGCGPGSITIGLAKLAPQGEVIGCDMVENVVQQAQVAAKEQNIENLSFRQLDANVLPFEDAAFDITFCHQVLQHVGDPVAVLKEMRRVTKAGGIVAARDAEYKSFAWYPDSEGLDQWLELYGRVGRANGTQPNAARYLPQWAKEAGFPSRNITFTWDCWNYQGDAAKLFGRSWIDRALHSGYATTSKKHGLATNEDLAVISRAWEKWTDDPDCFIVIPNGEILCRVE